MKGIIFDLDGTMVDNMMVHHRAWQRKLRSLGLEMDLEEVRQKVHGVNVEILEKLFGDRFTMEERIQISKEKELEYQKIFKPQLKLIDGLPSLLDEIKGRRMPLAIGSAAPPENVNFVLDHLDLWHYFEKVLHSDDVEKGKPDPEIYLKLTSQLNLDPRDCLVFEDTPAGATAASRAGCSLIVVTTTHQKNEFSGLTGIKKFVNNYHSVDLQRDVLL